MSELKLTSVNTNSSSLKATSSLKYSHNIFIEAPVLVCVINVLKIRKIRNISDFKINVSLNNLLANPSHADESWEGLSTCLWIYTLWIYFLNTLENIDENRMFFIHSLYPKHFNKAQHLVLWAVWWHQLFSTP